MTDDRIAYVWFWRKVNKDIKKKNDEKKSGVNWGHYTWQSCNVINDNEERKSSWPGTIPIELIENAPGDVPTSHKSEVTYEWKQANITLV